MTSRLLQFDRAYRRRMGVSLPLAVLTAYAVLVLGSLRGWFPDSRVPAQSGPLRILPQIDLEPVDHTRDTAAPQHPWSSEFTVEDIVIYDVPVEPVVEESPDPAATALVDVVRPPERNEQTDWRTSGQPVLALTEFEILYFERPLYPKTAREAGLEGLVEVLLQVGTNGLVARAEVVDAGRIPLLEDAAVAALRRTVFRPYRPEGDPSPFRVKIPVRFSLVD